MAKLPDPPVVSLRDGMMMPLLGFGTWALRGRSCYEAVRYALEVGYRHLDTATMYGNEAEVGRALQDSGVPREQVFVTTKILPGLAGRERATIEASLRALGSDYVDLWLIHSPPRGHAGPAIWRELLAARDQGLARSVGVSNYRLRQIDELAVAAGETPAVNQISWSAGQHDPRTLAGHRERGVVLEGYSPLRYSRLDHPVLARIGARHGVTPAQVVLRWHLEHLIPVIPKSSHRERIAANADLFGFSLTADEVARIDAM